MMTVCRRMKFSRLWLAGWLAALPFSPSNVMAFQDVQAIAVLVNDEVISTYDVLQRLRLLIASLGERPSEEEFVRLREQVIRSMVDEKLQLQEAAEFEVEVDPRQESDAFFRISQSFNQTPEQFETFLRQIGSSKDSLMHQVQAELSWQMLVRGRLGTQASVSEEEVEQFITRLENNAGAQEFLLSEIYLIVDDAARKAEVEQTAKRLVEQIRLGQTPFPVFAQQFSDAATAAVGGDMGWVALSQLPQEIQQTLASLELTEVSDPIEEAGGYHIIVPRDRRTILGADPLDAELDLQQVIITVSQELEQKEADLLLERISTASEETNSCSQISNFAAAVGSTDYSPLGKLKIRDLPPQLHSTLRDIPIGKPTTPFGTQQGLTILFVCDRSLPEVKAPEFDDVLIRLEDRRLAMMSRRYLRDIRRDAIIDYK